DPGSEQHLRRCLAAADHRDSAAVREAQCSLGFLRENLMNPRTRALVVLMFVAGVPASAYAQATLAGVVRDSSGAVLPGVTVDASSPALIERTRSGVTDGTGQYQIVDLRPGTYSVTFSLSGFRTVKREGVAISGAGAITINAELSVGGVAETVVVQGETP